MDESGGRGRPRSGNDEPAEHHAGPPVRATDPTPAGERPTDEHRSTPEQPTPSPEPHPDPTPPAPATDTPAAPRHDPTAAPAPAADTSSAPQTPDDETPDGRTADARTPDDGTQAARSADARTPDGETPDGRIADARTPDDGTQAAPTADARTPDGETQGGRIADARTADGETQGGRTADARTADGRTLDARSPDGRASGDNAPAPASSERDTHPDRAYAGGTDPAGSAGVSEGDRLRKAAPDPGVGSGDTDGRQAAQHPAPDPGHSGPHGDRPLAHSADGKGPAPRRPEPRGGLLMGRPFGVPVYVAPSWFLVAALITWVFGGQLERVLPELGAARYLVSLFFAVAFYASVLVHELAHTVAALRFKLPVRRIQLQFFGGVSEIEKEAETPGREFVLAFVGPLLSLVLAGVFYAALLAVEPGTVPGVLLAGLMISNLIVAAFNLLPGLPLDGGRMLRAVVWKITGKPMRGTVAAAWVGRALAVSVLIGLPLLTQSGALGTDAVDNVGMDTVLDALLAAILAAIIWTGAGNSLRMARLREHLPELQARALTRRAVPVETDTPLSEALRRANAAGARALVVVDADGHPLSLVREAAIVGVPEHRRPWVAVSGLAQDLTDGMRVSAELSGEELLDALRATPATEYLVVEETGEIYGVLSAADVERAFVKAMARPS
ncbi:site-2 protease family protein [Streptomyces sp. NPDC059696]|uniref:site-2 protease family protein n=1 Tax=Streptomyces sp. NPDC059696 TaxID=3346911 RepID=UPI0036A557FA